MPRWRSSETRKVRNDGTVCWDGGLLEVPGEYVGETVELRYPPLQPELPLLLFVDGKRVCEVHPLDRLANNKRRRRALPQPEAAPQRTLKGPLDSQALLLAEPSQDLGCQHRPGT